MKKVFRLSHDQARNLAQEYVRNAPEGHIVTIAEPTRTLEQNALLWPLLERVSSGINWYGATLTPEEWKDVFSASLKKQKAVPGLDGGFVVCGQSTSKMGKKEFSDLLEIIYAFAASKGVVL